MIEDSMPSITDKREVRQLLTELRAERARYDGLQRSALDILTSSACEEHASMAKKQTFQQFFAENHGKCLLCHVARAERTESELQQAKARIGRVREYLQARPHFQDGPRCACNGCNVLRIILDTEPALEETTDE